MFWLSAESYQRAPLWLLLRAGGVQVGVGLDAILGHGLMNSESVSFKREYNDIKRRTRYTTNAIREMKSIKSRMTIM